MIKFSFDKIVEFLRVQNWFIIKQNSSYLYFSPTFEFDDNDQNPNDFIIFLPKERKLLKDDIFDIWHTLSKFYTIPFYELALIHFAETPTVLTLGEYVSEFSHGIKEYADFLNQPFDLFKVSELFEGFERNLEHLYYQREYNLKFLDYCYFLYDGRLTLPLPKTVEHFVTDFLRIVGEQKRLKFNHKTL